MQFISGENETERRGGGVGIKELNVRYQSSREAINNKKGHEGNGENLGYFNRIFQIMAELFFSPIIN